MNIEFIDFRPAHICVYSSLITKFIELKECKECRGVNKSLLLN